jgi:hypothetical protein
VAEIVTDRAIDRVLGCMDASSPLGDGLPLLLETTTSAKGDSASLGTLLAGSEAKEERP